MPAMTAADPGDGPAPQAACDAGPTLRDALHQPALAGWCLAGLLALALLWVAQPFMVVVVGSVALAVLLWPALRAVESVLRLRVVAAVVVLAAACLSSAGLATVVADHAGRAVAHLPDALRLAARDVGRLQSAGAVTVQRTRSALLELDRNVARVTGTDPLPPAPAAKSEPRSLVGVVVARSTEWMAALLQVGSRLALTVGAIVLLGFFLLCSGDRLAARLSLWVDGRRIANGRFSPLVSDLALEVRRFGAVTLATNVLIGAAVGAGAAIFDIGAPLQWAVVAGMLHVVPYAGLLLTMVLVAVEVYVHSASATTALAAFGYVAAVGLVVGQISAVWLQGRASRIDSALMFGGTLFFAMLWGGWGLVLGPLLVVVVRAAVPHLRRRGRAAAATVAAAAAEPAFATASARAAAR